MRDKTFGVTLIGNFVSGSTPINRPINPQKMNRLSHPQTDGYSIVAVRRLLSIWSMQKASQLRPTSMR